MDMIEKNTQEELAPKEVGKQTYLHVTCYTFFQKGENKFL